MSYKLYVIDSDGRSAFWSHTNGGNRGLQPCLWFADNLDSVIVLEHESRTTHLYISADGEMEIEVIDE
jgi:hypothetical protein